MNTHSDGLYGTLPTLRKNKDLVEIGVSYASCGPTSCQGGCKVSEKDGMSHFTIMAWSNSCHTSSFIYTKQAKLYKQEKRKQERVFYSIYMRNRELSSHGLRNSPPKQIYNIYIVWQSSLVLDGLGRALRVPIAC